MRILDKTEDLVSVPDGAAPQPSDAVRHETVLADLLKLRAEARRATLLAAAASAGAVVLLALTLQVGAAEHWMTLLWTIVYVLLSLFRLVSGFQVDRQIELEHRFLQFAARHGRIVEAAEEAGRIWRLSCVVQGIRRASARLLTAGETERAYRQSLFTAGRLLHPVSNTANILVLAAVSVGWVTSVLMRPEARGAGFLLVLLPVIALLGGLEVLLRARRLRFRDAVRSQLNRIAAMAGRERTVQGGSNGGRPYRHRLLYRDPLRSG